MNTALIFSMVLYMAMAFSFFTVWLELFKQDTLWHSQNKLPSFTILIIATLFWPLVVPIAYLELLKAKQ